MVLDDHQRLHLSELLRDLGKHTLLSYDIDGWYLDEERCSDGETFHRMEADCAATLRLGRLERTQTPADILKKLPTSPPESLSVYVFFF